MSIRGVHPVTFYFYMRVVVKFRLYTILNLLGMMFGRLRLG